MNSFAFFYDGNKNDNIKVNLHVNIWTLEEEKPIIDIGMKIEDTNDIKTIFIYVPFKIELSDIDNLSDKLTDPKLSNLIFNYDCSVTKDTIEINNTKYRLLDIDTIKKLYTCKDGCLLTLNINSYNGSIYVRFRIKSSALSSKLIYKEDKLYNIIKISKKIYNIVDLKINKKRDFPYEKFIKQKGNFLFNFNKIHFLVMDYVYNDIKFLSKHNYEVRTLEEGWEKYIELNETKLGNSVAYHFQSIKDKGSNENEFEVVLKILKIKFSKMLLLIYLGIGIISGIMSGIMSSIIHSLISKLF